ncbi:MAG: orotate phosphoribosyltransferase [Candidatus Woesearchaeota archaeon]|nr:orotate phosphoribosyltransferase [Candidatus Woesearchaeota archaeon]
MKKGMACMICEAGIGRFTCDLCGLLACADCFDRAKNMCVQCSGGRRV